MWTCGQRWYQVQYLTRENRDSRRCLSVHVLCWCRYYPRWFVNPSQRLYNTPRDGSVHWMCSFMLFFVWYAYIAPTAPCSHFCHGYDHASLDGLRCSTRQVGLSLFFRDCVSACYTFILSAFENNTTFTQYV
jgi:hypothetical protein